MQAQCHCSSASAAASLQHSHCLRCRSILPPQVWEQGAPPPPDSPPLQFPPADLFPEQRIAVFRITQAQLQ